jgi:dihydroflavonol-4-reductase
MTKTAYVTGSNGFLGLNLVEQLNLQGWLVMALHRHTSDTGYLKRHPVEMVEGDINDPASLARTLPLGVDAVFHVAGSTSLWARKNAEQDRINIDGTHNMVEAALNAGAKRFVHTSSISAYGLQSGTINETAEQLGAISPINYQRSKFAAEEEVRKGIARDLDAVILNPAGIIGRYDTGGYARMFRLVNAGKLPGVPPGSLSFCHAREVAKAHIAAAERGRTGERYLLGGADASFMALVKIIGELCGKPVPDKPTSAWVLKAAGMVGNWASLLTGKEPTLTPERASMVTRSLFCDCSKAMRELGYLAVPLRTMTEDCYEWLKQEGLLEGQRHGSGQGNSA